MSNLKTREKLSYGVADFGAALSITTIGFFLLHFLVNVVGLRPALAGSVLLIGNLIDAITDPLMGAISDRTRAIWGKRKPYILWGAIPFGLSFALIWFTPEATANQLLGFVFATGLLLFHTITFTVVHVPYLALTPELAPTYNERTVLTSYRIGFATFATLIAAAAPPLLVASLNSSQGLEEGTRFGWLLLGGIFGGMCSLCYLLMALNVREPVRKTKLVEQNLWRNYLTTLKAYGFMPILLLFMTITIAMNIVSSLVPFHLESVSNLNPEQQTFILGLLFGTAIISLPLWNVLSRLYSKRLAFTLGLLVLALNLPLLIWLSAGASLSLKLVVITMLAGVGTGAVLLFPWAMLPDVVEFDELATGTRREGTLYAIFTFGQKISVALAVFINGQVLELINYKSDAIIQSSITNKGIMLMAGPVAGLIFVSAIFWVWRYPISQAAHQKAIATLKNRE